MRRSVAALLALGALVALAAPAPGRALTCPNIPLSERLAAADAAFVGRVDAVRVDSGGGSVYRFDVKQRVKGPVAGLVEVAAGARLTDAQGRALVRGTDVGVLAGLEGATLSTSSCLLTDPAALLAEADTPRGNVIKVLIGLVILLAVVLWAASRRRRGVRPELPGAPG